MASDPPRRTKNLGRLIADAAKEARNAGEIDEYEEARWLNIAQNIAERRRARPKIEAAE